MDAIQRLRTKAEANNKLTSTKEQKVTKKQEQGKQVIVIEPTEPDTVYVPYYDPGVVYGGWPYPAYPPYYFPPPGYIAGGIIAAGIAFGAGYALGRWASGGNYWGGGVNWGNNNININRPVNINNIGGNNWQHDPEHRQGVKYNNTNVQQKFGNNNVRGGSQNRMDFRGRGGEQVLKPGGGGQANLGDRGGAGARVQAAAAQRPGAGAGAAAAAQVAAAVKSPSGGEPGGGQRPSARPAGGGGGGNALGNIQSGRVATRNPRADTPVSGPRRRRWWRARGRRRWRRVAAVVAAVAAAVVAAAAAVAVDGDRISRSSTISFFSVISTTALASIASAITAASKPMSA